MREVRKLQGRLSELPRQALDLLVRELQQAIGKTEFVHHFQSRRVNGVAAKVTEEVGMLFEHDDACAGSCQKVSEHQPGRTPAGDGTVDMVVLGQGAPPGKKPRKG